MHIRYALVLLFAGLASSNTMAATLQRDPMIAPRGTYAVDEARTSVTFAVTNGGLGDYVSRFQHASGSLSWNPANLSDSKLSIAVDVNSLASPVPAFNQTMLQGNEYFDAPHHPSISFVSKGVQRTGPDHGVLHGDVTIRGVTRPLTLDVTFLGAAADAPGSHHRIAFAASGRLQRSPFGVTGMIPMMSDEVRLTINAEFVER